MILAKLALYDLVAVGLSFALSKVRSILFLPQYSQRNRINRKTKPQVCSVYLRFGFYQKLFFLNARN